tara:strand:- start:1266 stop:2279 length:1014 start_codon:yes stop_codon:yes gene_type:complete
MLCCCFQFSSKAQTGSLPDLYSSGIMSKGSPEQIDLLQEFNLDETTVNEFIIDQYNNPSFTNTITASVGNTEYGLANATITLMIPSVDFKVGVASLNYAFNVKINAQNEQFNKSYNSTFAGNVSFQLDELFPGGNHAKINIVDNYFVNNINNLIFTGNSIADAKIRARILATWPKTPFGIYEKEFQDMVDDKFAGTTIRPTEYELTLGIKVNDGSADFSIGQAFIVAAPVMEFKIVKACQSDWTDVFDAGYCLTYYLRIKSNVDLYFVDAKIKADWWADFSYILVDRTRRGALIKAGESFRVDIDEDLDWISNFEFLVIVKTLDGKNIFFHKGYEDL